VEAPVLHIVRDQHLWLSGERAVFWEEEKILIASDLHFGKTGHFRKSGIAVPQSVYKEDLQRLVSLLHYFKPVRLIVVGDFFHSHANTELDWFRKWRQDLGTLDITLVRGNHDILSQTWYEETNIEVIEPELRIGPFLFTHDRCDRLSDQYIFCGHIHPGILLNGAGRQSLRLPCFYFGPHFCILPAFSRFTGAVALRPEATDHIFAIAERKLIRLQ
jgi:DNA ligase-associated metallophosphoesterase